MASDIRMTGASVQRDVPRILFQPAFFSSAHAGGPIPCLRCFVRRPAIPDSAGREPGAVFGDEAAASDESRIIAALRLIARDGVRRVGPGSDQRRPRLDDGDEGEGAP